MSIKRFQKRFIARAAALILAFLLFHGNLAFPASGQEKRDLEGPFKWATGDYQAGKYYDALRNLELLLSYYEETETVLSKKEKRLKGKIHLLLGASYEKLRSLEKARQQYRLAKELLDYPHIENVDFTGMSIYQGMFMQASQTVDQGIIIKPKKKKKKRISPLLIIATVAVIVGGVAFALIKNKKKEEKGIDFVPDFDTRELGIQWVQIPGGEFLMGDNFNEGDPDEQPVHTVSLDGYKISRFEITYAQYDRFCQDKDRTVPSGTGWGRGDRPVSNITWGEAELFCQWLSEKTGKNIYLPTEAQWEFAARGPDQRRYPWGNREPASNLCNYGNLQAQTLPVGSFPDGASPYGVQDMAGNVAEWCRDKHDEFFYGGQSPVLNPVNLPESDYIGYVFRVVRGGSWNDLSLSLRAAARERGRMYFGVNAFAYGRNNTHDNKIGFRVVLENQ